MNTGNLKSYAPQARKDFIAAVTARANLLGLSETKGALQVAEAEVKNDIVMIAGRPWPVKVNEQRNKLIARMKLQGFGHTVEAVAYAWFNRLAALRYMELHDYLGHGRRVLSNPQGGLPEVLAHALDLAESNALPGLSADTVRELKLANQDPELYRLILIAQCNALHQAMPFLFEQLGDETELLLPENLLLSDSVVAKLVQSIPEEDWQQIEIIGWLYQFYISEKKDQVIGKVVKSEDIPAATQLFTPNWIVKYMVQNSLGAQWLATYPDSPLKAQMAYYIEPAEQPDEVKAQLAATTPSQLDPEELTLIDPACGSGHILVEAYELFKAIYLERGYRQRDVAKLILERNLFGLDIDERAAQLTGFALMMKGRADDRRLFEREVQLGVMALVDSAGFDAEGLAKGVELSEYGLGLEDLTHLKRLFEDATTFGSLIQVPEGVAKKLPELKKLSEATSQDLFVSEALKRLEPLVRQVERLASQYDVLVANPPYMGGKYMGKTLKGLVQRHYYSGRGDLFACFLLRQGDFVAPTGKASLVTMDAWMFLSGFRDLRLELLHHYAINSLVHVGWNCFPEGHTYNRGVALTLSRAKADIVGRYLNLSNVPATVTKGQLFLHRRSTGADHYDVARSDFLRVPDSPIAYWISPAIRASFENPSLGDIAELRAGITTGDNDRFVRYWPEVSWCSTHTTIDSREGLWANPEYRWVPLKSGGDFRKWYGNFDKIIRFDPAAYNELRNMGNRCASEDCYFRPGITWSDIGSTKDFGARYCGAGAVFSTVGHSLFAAPSDVPAIGALLCSKLSTLFLALINPTLHANPGDVARIPFTLTGDSRREVERIYAACVDAAVHDWDQSERSWNFQSHPILTVTSTSTSTLESSYIAWITQNRATIADMKRLEEENNRLFICAYGLGDELMPDVPIEQITLTVNPAYRYGGKVSEEEQRTRFRQDSMAELVSYAIGCMMGRYSLDAPGLIYAHSGNVGFDASRYARFPADADGIVPVTDELWFEDDAALRVREFLLAVWGKDSLEQNMAFLANNLGRKASESSEQAIRRYLADKFFKDHLQTYKKRPIYWLFSSGKQGAFQALVYLHRYNAGTLSRLRAEYVVPLTGKMQTKLEELEQDVAASSSTAQRNKLTKQLEKLRKQHLELLAYDEQLRHYADQRITLDLDEGVKVNYGKFGDLLAEVKAVTGGKGDDE